MVVEGKTQKDDNGVKILADRIFSLEDYQPEAKNGDVHIQLVVDQTDKSTLIGLRDIFKKHPGGQFAMIHIVTTSEKAEAIIRASEDLRVTSGLALYSDVNGFLGYDAIL